MPDDNTQVDDGQIDDGQVDDGQIDGDGDKKQSDADFMTDTVDFIKDTQKAILGEEDNTGTDDDTQDTNDSGVLSDLAGTDIPDVFSEAAEAMGMTPSEIIKHADTHTDEELIEEAGAIMQKLKELDEAAAEVDDKVTKQDDKTDKDADNKDIDPELVKSITEKISKQLEEKFSTTLEEINKFKAYQENQLDIQNVKAASKFFDEASKEFPVFGKTDELPKFPSGRLAGQLIPTSPAMKARLEVLRYADSFIQSGSDRDTALANGYATYKGLHLEKELERKQVRDLKSHETKLSGARTGRETKKKFADARDEIIDDIRQMQRAAGIE